MRFFPYLALLCHSGALFTRPSAEKIYDVIITPLTTIETSVAVPSTTVLSQTRDSSITRFSRSTLVTMAPLSMNPLDVRQKCFDDRGFSVECAAWTGYYYTWGPPGDPYRGGPGDDNGSGSGYTSGTGNSMMPLAICYIVLINILTLWAALSLS